MLPTTALMPKAPVAALITGTRSTGTQPPQCAAPKALPATFTEKYITTPLHSPAIQKMEKVAENFFKEKKTTSSGLISGATYLLNVAVVSARSQTIQNHSQAFCVSIGIIQYGP